MNDKEKLGVLEIYTIIAAITAFCGDIITLFAIGFIIPIIGFSFLFFGLGGHYLAGIIVGAAVFRRLSGLVSKIILGIGIILPLPTLSISLGLAILFQSKIIQTVGIAAVGIATGGAGAVAAEGAEVAAGAEAAAGAAEFEGAATGTEAAGGTMEAAEEEKTAAGAARAGKEIPPEELGERPELMEELQKKLLERTPSGGQEQGGEEESDDEDDDEDVGIDGNEVDLRRSV